MLGDGCSRGGALPGNLGRREALRNVFLLEIGLVQVFGEGYKFNGFS